MVRCVPLDRGGPRPAGTEARPPTGLGTGFGWKEGNMFRRLTAAIAAIAFGIILQPAAAKAPDTWDGLIRVKAKQLDAAYLLPNADFRAYSKVLLDPSQFALRKDWVRDRNRSAARLGGRITDEEAREKLDEARQEFDKIFAETFQKAGYAVVTQPGSDVLRLSLAVIDLSVNAPDTMTSARVRTYSLEAGEATLAVEARDSVTGQLLGRAIDRRTAGEGPTYRRTESSNRADFEELFRQWAKEATKGIDRLKAESPIDAEGRKVK